MLTRLQSIPLSFKITVLVTAIVVLSVSVVGLRSVEILSTNMQTDVGNHMLNLAKLVATMPEIKTAISRNDPLHAVQPVAEKIRRLTGADLVVIINMDSIRLSHPILEMINAHYAAGDEEKALHGQSYISYASCARGPSIRGLAPIFDGDGRQIGVAVVGMLVDTVALGFHHVRFAVNLALLVALSLGFIGAVLLSRNIKAAIHGLEPKDIATLLQQREAMLQSIKEGIIAIDQYERISFFNEGAQKLLGITAGAINKPIQETNPLICLTEVLQTGQAEYNREYILDEAIIVANVVPIIINGKVEGAIATFRDKTEISRLAEELTGVKKFVEALRAQRHEFMNKLHTISGLIQIRSYQEAVEYICQATKKQQELLTLLPRQIHDPAVVGLLLGKISEAEERGVTITIDPQTHLSSLPRHFDSNALVCVLGNLLENAIEAIADTNAGGGKVYISIQEANKEIRILVSDNGPGIPPQIRQNIFSKGTSSKGLDRGIGLYLMHKEIAKAYGRIEVHSTENQGTSFEVQIPLNLLRWEKKL